MELIAKYIELHKPANRFIDMMERFLGDNKKLFPYQRKILESINSKEKIRLNQKMLMIGRRSGRTDMDMDMAIMAIMDEIDRPSIPRYQVSRELIEDGYSNVVSDAITAASASYVQHLEQQMFSALAIPARELQLANGSRISSMVSSDVARGQSYHRYDFDTLGADRQAVPPDFPTEYLSTWASDSDGDYRDIGTVGTRRMLFNGDVPSVHADSKHAT
jgi:hypothetical protein